MDAVLKPIKAGFDHYNYNRYVNLEKDYNDAVNNLLDYCKSILGTKNVAYTISKIIDNPIQFVVDNYCNLFLNDFPSHHDPIPTIEVQSAKSLQPLSGMRKNIIDISKQLGQYKPTIIKNKIVSTIQKSDFDMYVAEEKIKEYEAVVSFLKEAENLKKHVNVGYPRRLAEYLPNLVKLTMTGVEPNLNYFCNN